jgi:hypothetical protein
MTGRPVSESVVVCTSMPQPTPQYEQAVRVVTMTSWWAGTVPVVFRRRYRKEN